MCGIAGWAGSGSPTEMGAMVKSLGHRGPDETGSWIGEHAALGIARLAIVDVSRGHQPVYSSDLSVVAVMNGEIYNHRELARDLENSGVVLRSKSDAEIIPHLYRQYGLDFVHELRGMFAVVLWDEHEKQLVMVRDRVGKKPLLYAMSDNKLTFASEARALLAAGCIGDVDLAAVDHVMAFGYVPTNSGAFRGLEALEPGHLATFKDGVLDSRPYWTWRPGVGLESFSNIAARPERIEAILDEAVKIRLISERPVGAFLSGGIDSTIVTALMIKHSPDRLQTFSVGFKDRRFDESGFARAVSEYLGTDHSELIVDTHPAILLDKISSVFDQPFADSSAIPTHLLSDLASQSVVVALSGDGGDEVFGGYIRYKAVPALQKLNGLLGVARPLRKPLLSLADRSEHPRLGRLARQLQAESSLGSRYLEVMSLIPLALRKRIWTVEAQENFSVGAATDNFAAVWDEFDRGNDLDTMRMMDMASYLPGDLLTKVDIASMSCSLEVRSPFLDQEVLGVAASLPHHLLIRRGVTKWLLREVAYRLVPKHLIDRPKQGFAVPQADWLRGPLREMSRDLLLDRTARQRGWFVPGVVEQLMNTHDSGVDQDRYIWPLLMIELWARQWVDASRMFIPATER